MKKKVLITGISHAGALIAAARNHRSEIDFSWFCTPSRLPVLRDGLLLKATANTKEFRSEETLPIESYDEIIFSAVGSGSPRDVKWNHPFFEISLRPTSEDLLASLIISCTHHQRVFARSLKDAGAKRIVCQRWPLPSEAALRAFDFFDLSCWNRFLRAEDKILSNFCSENGIELLDFPEGAEVFTPQDEVLESDGYHTSEKYGSKILQSSVAPT